MPSNQFGTEPAATGGAANLSNYYTKAEVNGHLSGKCTKTAGKLDTSEVPDLALTSVTTVADNTARDALTVQQGDVAYVSGDGLTYMWSGAAWVQIDSTSVSWDNVKSSSNQSVTTKFGLIDQAIANTLTVGGSTGDYKVPMYNSSATTWTDFPRLSNTGGGGESIICFDGGAHEGGMISSLRTTTNYGSSASSYEGRYMVKKIEGQDVVSVSTEAQTSNQSQKLKIKMTGTSSDDGQYLKWNNGTGTASWQAVTSGSGPTLPSISSGQANEILRVNGQGTDLETFSFVLSDAGTTSGQVSLKAVGHSKSSHGVKTLKGGTNISLSTVSDSDCIVINSTASGGGSSGPTINDSQTTSTSEVWSSDYTAQQVAGRAALSHNHDDRYYTESEVDTFLAAKAAASHNHDDRYYTESEVDTFLAAKAAASHNHDDRYYTESEVDTFLAAKAAASHNHDSVYIKIADRKSSVSSTSTDLYDAGYLNTQLDVRMSKTVTDMGSSGTLLHQVTGNVLGLKRLTASGTVSLSEANGIVTISGASGGGGSSDGVVTGGSVSGTTLTLTRSSGGNVTITGLPSGGSSDGVVTGGSVSGTTLTLTRSGGLSDLTVTGLPSGADGNNYVTGGSVSGTTMTLTRQGLGDVTITGLPSTADTNNYVTGGSVSGTTLTLTRQGLGDLTITGLPSAGSSTTDGVLTGLSLSTTGLLTATTTNGGATSTVTQQISTNTLGWKWYAAISDLPTASSYHGAVFHVHNEGAMYFSHGGNWHKISNDGHTHAIADVTGLATSLSNKANLTHSHAISDITNLQSELTTLTNNVTANSNSITSVTSLANANQTNVTTALTRTVNMGVFPNQGGQATKFLTTDGSVISWANTPSTTILTSTAASPANDEVYSAPYLNSALATRPSFPSFSTASNRGHAFFVGDSDSIQVGHKDHYSFSSDRAKGQLTTTLSYTNSTSPYSLTNSANTYDLLPALSASKYLYNDGTNISWASVVTPTISTSINSSPSSSHVYSAGYLNSVLPTVSTSINNSPTNSHVYSAGYLNGVKTASDNRHTAVEGKTASLSNNTYTGGGRSGTWATIDGDLLVQAASTQNASLDLYASSSSGTISQIASKGNSVTYSSIETYIDSATAGAQYGGLNVRTVKGGSILPSVRVGRNTSTGNDLTVYGPAQVEGEFTVATSTQTNVSLNSSLAYSNNQYVSKITTRGKNAASNTIEYSTQHTQQCIGTAGGEYGQVVFSTRKSGALVTALVVGAASSTDSDVIVNGELKPTGGIKFADGTTLTTAPGASGGTSVDATSTAIDGVTHGDRVGCWTVLDLDFFVGINQGFMGKRLINGWRNIQNATPHHLDLLQDHGITEEAGYANRYHIDGQLLFYPHNNTRYKFSKCRIWGIDSNTHPTNDMMASFFGKKDGDWKCLAVSGLDGQGTVTTQTDAQMFANKYKIPTVARTTGNSHTGLGHTGVLGTMTNLTWMLVTFTHNVDFYSEYKIQFRSTLSAQFWGTANYEGQQDPDAGTFYTKPFSEIEWI